MADYVMNVLQIESDDANFINRFKYAFTSPTKDEKASFLDFEKILPEPAELRLAQHPGAMDSNLYEWRCKNWGTKWNSWNDYNITGEDNQIFFTTAWNPPVPIIEKLSSLCPGVQLTLFSVREADEVAFIVTFLNGEKVLTTMYDKPSVGDRMVELVTGKETDTSKLFDKVE